MTTARAGWRWRHLETLVGSVREAAVVWLVCGLGMLAVVAWQAAQPSPPSSVLFWFLPTNTMVGVNLGMGALFVLLAYGTWQIAGVIEARQRAAEARGLTLREMKLMAPPEFERFVGSLFRRLGFAVTETPYQGDHGVDLYADKPGERAVVQCKRYRDWQVGEDKIRDLFGVLHHEGADRAYLVTTGRFTRKALDWAKGKPVTLWEGSDLERLARQASDTSDQSVSAPPVGGGAAVSQDATTASSTVTNERTCAQCGRWVSDGVRRYCADNAARFGGHVYCMEHQKGK